MKISRRQVVWRRDANDSRRKSVTGIRFVVVIVVSALCTSGIAIAQTAPPAPPHVPLQKTIGGVTKPEVVPSLIVLNSHGVSLQGNKLVLTGVAPNSIVLLTGPFVRLDTILRATSLMIGRPAVTTSQKIPPTQPCRLSARTVLQSATLWSC